MIKKHGNIIVLLLTLILYAYHVIQNILLINDVPINFGFISQTLFVIFPCSIIATIIISGIYFFKQRNKKNLSFLILSLFTLSGFIVIFHLLAIAASGIS